MCRHRVYTHNRCIFQSYYLIIVIMNTSELNRLLHNLCRVGLINELDFEQKKVKVKLSETQTTAWLNWPAEIGNNFVRWRPLRLQTQVLILCPSGDISQGHIVGMMYSQDIQPPSTEETIDIIAFEDGTEIQYDSAAKALSIIVKGTTDIDSEKDITIKTDGNATIEATGNATITAGGNITTQATAIATVDGLQVILTDGASGGVVCQGHVCAFTGGPHPQGSTTVLAGG
jgi:phage baseplate assembly protein V